jgi:folate-dependent tRNA-U54 methylase TrmFO/GidA
LSRRSCGGGAALLTPGRIAEVNLYDRRSTYINSIAMLQLLFKLNRNIVKRCAIAAAQIQNIEGFPTSDDLGVITRNIRISLKADAIVQRAPYGDALVTLAHFKLALRLAWLNNDK